jgi:Tfp pilus assembly protein PilO
MTELLNLKQQMLGEILQKLPTDETDLRVELNTGMEQLLNSEGYREMKRQLEEVLGSLPLELNLKKEISDTLKGGDNTQIISE